MICEFAIEPELVASWSDPKEYAFFDERFGVDTRRIVSQYPKKWRRMVRDAYTKISTGDDNTKKKFDALMTHLLRNSVKRPSTFPDLELWLERAEAEHNERPFFGILAQKNPRAHSHVIKAKELAENKHERWKIPDLPVTARNSAEFATVVEPVLAVCQNILFVDPYFDPAKQRFREPMAGFLDKIWNCRCGLKGPAVELHTGIDRYFRKGGRTPEKEKRISEHLAQGLQEILPKIIPARQQVVAHIWKQKERGERLHNRYILTEVCGISFGVGLDQAADPGSAETDDLKLLTSSQRHTRWKHFKGQPNAYELMAPPLVIKSSIRS